MEEFIVKTNGKDSMIRSHRHAKKGRALGLGVMGWHTFLQQKNLPFNSIASTAWTHTIFSQIKTQAEEAFTNDLRYHLVKKILNGNKQKFQKLLANQQVIEMSMK